MTHSNFKNLTRAGLVLSCGLLLSACSDNDSVATPAPAPDVEFEIQITNLTNAQPLSPPAIVIHEAGYHAFVDGQAASLGLEMLAEGGDNDQLLAEAVTESQYIAHVDIPAPIAPRAKSPVYNISVPQADLANAHVSLVSMLVRTNDAFSAIDGKSISGLQVNETMRLSAPVWDAGTEANSEATDTIPGPGLDGEGFNATRDDRIAVVRFHQGIVGNTKTEDGLTTSVLGEQHRFDNPSMRISITRVR